MQNFVLQFTRKAQFMKIYFSIHARCNALQFIESGGGYPLHFA